MAFDLDKEKNTRGKTSGFQNRPGQRKHDRHGDSPLSVHTRSSQMRDRSDSGESRRNLPQRRRPDRRLDVRIPWEIVLPLVCVIVAVTMIWVFRDAITAFLSQLLSWAVMIVILVFIIKKMIFPK